MRYILLLSILCAQVSWSQLVTFPGTPAQSLVQNVLLGPGVTVSNITYTGPADAISKFNAAGTNLGINEGIVMTTGTTQNNGYGPHGPNNMTNAGFNNNSPGNAQLSSIIGGTQTYNATILEFDFIPYSDTVRFKYVFGSEEYPEFAPPNNSQYNDVFGFFISGPGISGLQNIARLPSGAVVSINNVNQSTNSQYFTPNGDGNSSPQNSSPYYIQYDGFTKVLEAVSRVQCGQTYHLKLAVADVGDGLYDSGIFLEANSLSSKTPIDISYELSNQAFSDPSIMAEGCVSSTITLTRSNNTSSALTIPVNVSGTATQNIDYSNIPTSVTFAAGQSQAQFSFNALADGLLEGQESIVLEFPIMDPCGNLTPIVINLGIDDVNPVTVSLPDSTLTCPGTPILLTATALGGGGVYSYTWSTGATTPSITVNPATTQIYSVSVTDNCLNQTATDQATVTVPVYPPITIQASADITEICPYVEHTLSVNPIGGAGGYVTQWLDPSQLGLITSQTLTVKPSQSTTYIVYVTDLCGNKDSSSIIYTITSPPLIVSITPDTTLCPGDSALLVASASGGYGNYFYSWMHNGSSNDSVWVRPMDSYTYVVQVSDECQTFYVENSSTVTILEPVANFTILSNTLFDDLPITFENLSVNGVSYQWDFGNGMTSTIANPSTTYLDPGTYFVTLISTDINGCIDTISKIIKIEPEYYVYVPNTFTPNNNRTNDYFYVSTVGVSDLQITIFNRWGEAIYTSEDLNFNWDGSFGNKLVPTGVYTWKLNYRTNSGRRLTATGHVNVLY